MGNRQIVEKMRNIQIIVQKIGNRPGELPGELLRTTDTYNVFGLLMLDD
jgi:hypothetical protein